jgi:Putative Ig domain
LAPNRSIKTNLIGTLLFLFAASILVGCAGGVSSSQTIPHSSTTPLTISTTSLPGGQVGSAYQNSLSATGGTPPYHWSIASGTLPNGLGINAASGMIAGQPAAAGTFGFAVSVQDSSASNASVRSQMSMQITAAPATKAPLQISTSSLPSGEVGDSYDSQVVAAGGTPPYRWSIASGVLPGGLGINSSTGVISGQPSAAGVFSFAVSVQDSSANKSSAQSEMSVKVIAAPISPAPAASTYYGSGIGSDGLGNTTIGPNQNKLSYRIRAQHTGFLSAIQPYLIMDHTGYWGGTSGSILVSIQTDDGSSSHNPSGQKLTSSLLNDPDSVPTPTRYFPTFTFSAPASVTAGELYHIVFENTDSNPSVNFVSVDALYQAAAPTPSQPTMSDTDCAVLLFSAYSDGTVWKPRQGYTPVVQMDFEDGFTQGYGYMEVWVGTPETISGTATVRETFTVSGVSDTVSSMSVRVARVSGAGALTLRLESGDGTLIEQGTVAASSVPIGSSPTYVWASYKFSSPHTLAVGQSYHLVLQSSSSTVYQAYPIRKGSDYGYKSTTFFPDGYAQFLQSGTWVGWTQWGVADRTDGDLQFYFAP